MVADLWEKILMNKSFRKKRSIVPDLQYLFSTQRLKFFHKRKKLNLCGFKKKLSFDQTVDLTLKQLNVLLK